MVLSHPRRISTEPKLILFNYLLKLMNLNYFDLTLLLLCHYFSHCLLAALGDNTLDIHTIGRLLDLTS